MHLLQLAGGQAWPNLLPILALEPTFVTFLTSSDPNQDYLRSIEAIRDACLAAGFKFNFKVVPTTSKDPTTNECRMILGELAPDCVNLTGGTKPMSIAAYELAQHKSIPAFYLDTRRKSSPCEAVNSISSAINDRLNHALPAIVSKITVPIALKANGFPVPPYFKSPPKNWMDFSVRAAELRQDPEADTEISKAVSNLRRQLMGNDGDMPRKGKLRSVLQHPISAPIDSHWAKYLLAASAAEIIQLTESDVPGCLEFLLLRVDPTDAAADQLRSLANETFKLLEGIWFELALLAHLQQKSSFTDISWSVEADHLQDPAASSRGETDLVAFNAAGLSLHFISCKTSGPHAAPLDHIQGLRSRATKEGGNFSKAELWIFRAKSDAHRKDLENHCKAQGVTLRVFTDIQP